MTTPLDARKLLALGGLVSLLLVAESALAQRPNILLITADDMNWDSVGVYGCPVEETTPNIDRLASKGIQFDYGYVQIAICTPSRQVMLSGSHSHQTMTRCFTELERVSPALPDMLKQNGYHIANINKQQVFYDWDTAIKETESGFGRDIRFHGEAVPSIKKRTDFHKYRILEELYNVRQDPHAYINVAAEAENRDRLVAMRTLLVDWMEDTDHPATELMKDPHNERLIAEYMAWERANAVKQVEEVKRGKR